MDTLQLDPSKLKAARLNAGIRRSKLAEILGASKAYVINAENGWFTPTASALLKWAAACGIENVKDFYTAAPEGAFSTRKKYLVGSDK